MTRIEKNKKIINLIKDKLIKYSTMNQVKKLIKSNISDEEINGPTETCVFKLIHDNTLEVANKICECCETPLVLYRVRKL